MKLAVVLSALFIGSVSFAAAKNYEVTIKKGEMSCKECADQVKKALTELPEVDKNSVKVILAKNTATLQIKDGANVSADQIKDILKKHGYTAMTVQSIQ